MGIDRDEIERLTAQYGGDWGINHSRRLLKLIEKISGDRAYDSDAVWVAAHLHDWGGYSPWAQTGVDHAERSVQVAGSFLREREVPKDFVELVLECIRLHHQGGSQQIFETVLLSEADVLDFLGVVGVLRDFSKNPRDLRRAYEISKKRSTTLPQTLRLEKSKEIGRARLKEMDELFERFEHDSWGLF